MKEMWKKRMDPGSSVKRKGKNQGIITVFVTLIMVPVVAICGIMVDVSRLKLYSSQAVMAADSYGDTVLSEFDNLLKQLYGLFSVTQNEDGLAAIEQMAEYTVLSFHPDGDDRGLSGFMPYKDTEVEVSYEKVEGASLSNNNVLMTQISDFMRFRIVEEVMEEGGILDCLEQFDSLAPDTKAMEERSKITDSSTKALGKIDEYYKQLKMLAEYPAYLEGRQNAYEKYSEKLTEIVDSEEYEDYVYYLEHREEIEAAISAFEETEEDDDESTSSNENTNNSGSANSSVNTGNKPAKEDMEKAKQFELYERFADFDLEEYVKTLKESLEECAQAAKNNESDPIDFSNTGSVIKHLQEIEGALRNTLQTLKEQVDSLKAQLNSCSDSVREGIEKEIKQLENIISYADDFKETCQLIAVTKDCKALNVGNQELMQTEVKVLQQAKEKLLQGKVEPTDSYWAKTVPLVWYDFRDDKNTFYEKLKKLCEPGNDNNVDKNKTAKKQINKADGAQKEAESKIKGNEQTSSRDISDSLASQLGRGGMDSGKIPALSEYFTGGLSFEALSQAGSNVLDKFMVTTYDFGMFTSRVTGIKPEEENSTKEKVPEEPSEEKYEESSLTGIPMSPNINYLYGAELEYLFGGHNNSVSNLNDTRNIICGVRMTMNFASTYKIKELDSVIDGIANAAVEAAAVTGVGAAAAPLIYVAVSGALRMAVATIETAADWDCLKKRESVILIKSKLGELQSADAIADLLNMEITKEESGHIEPLKLSYEDYMYILLCLLVDDNTLLSRTSDLITLNVNQAKNKGDTLSDLNFKMSDTVTAVKSTCKVKADFVVLPENFAAMFLSGTSTESRVEWLENHFFGYSVIRGY